MAQETFTTSYLVTKTGKYVTYDNKLIIVDSATTGDIIVMQEGSDGRYTELYLTVTTTPPIFS